MDLLYGSFEVHAWWAFRPGVVVWGGNWSWFRVDAELASVGTVEVEMAEGSFDAPTSFVDQGVMMPAEEDQIVETGGSAL